jgi:hypothetical protein
LFQLCTSSDLAGNADKILDVLIQYLVLEHIDYAVELGLQGKKRLNDQNTIWYIEPRVSYTGVLNTMLHR